MLAPAPGSSDTQDPPPICPSPSWGWPGSSGHSHVGHPNLGSLQARAPRNSSGNAGGRHRPGTPLLSAKGPLCCFTSQPQPLQDLIREDSPRAPAHTRPAPHPLTPVLSKTAPAWAGTRTGPAQQPAPQPPFLQNLRPTSLPSQPGVYRHTSSPRATPTPPPPRPRPSTLPPTRLPVHLGSCCLGHWLHWAQGRPGPLPPTCPSERQGAAVKEPPHHPLLPRHSS